MMNKRRLSASLKFEREKFGYKKFEYEKFEYE